MTTAVHAPVHSRSIDAIADEYATDLTAGLDVAVARQRLAADGANTIATDPPPTIWQLAWRQFRDPLVLLLVAAILISLVAWSVEEDSGWPIDAIVIGLIVLVNAALGAFQEHRADDAVRALSRMTEGHAQVRRSNKLVPIAFSEIVRGDLIELTEGDLVPADGRVAASESLLVAEAALTGESVAVLKHPDRVPAKTALGDRTAMVHAGTAIVAGHGTYVVTATAMDTEVGRIASMLVETEQLATPLEREIQAVSRFLGAAVVVIATVISVVIGLTTTIDSLSDLVDVLLLGVSIAVAAVPEGLPAVLSIVLAVGVSRMAKRNALVKRLAAAETLGSATVICTDKTGTLTQNKMRVRTVVVQGGRLELPSNVREGDIENRIFCALMAGSAASNVNVEATGTDWQVTGDPTEVALVNAVHELGLDSDQYESVHRVSEIPFDANRKRMSVLVTGFPTPSVRTVVTKGAPDVVLERCSHQLGFWGPVALSAADKARWQQQIDELADQAMRTLLVAYRDVPDNFVLTADEEQDLVVLGVIGILDPPRPEVASAIATAQEAGIRVIMLTGDHPNTGGRIAADLGIEGATQHAVVIGHEIDELDDEKLAVALDTHAVFARVAPAHKLRMVQALQRRGHVVAMTGDGVNDAPALKAADIGTAMGKSGTAVAREAADMVLVDDDFGTIIEAIRGGRTIFRNIANFLRYLLSSNVGEVLTIFLGVVFAGLIGLDLDDDGILAPLTAAQILWINLLTDTGPAFALGLDEGDAAVMTQPPRAPGSRVIDKAMQRGILIVGLTMAVATLLALDSKLPGGLIEGSSDTTEARTMAFTVLVLAQLFNCFSARSDSQSAFVGWAANPLLLVAVAGSFLLQLAVVYAPPLQRGFATTGLSFNDWLVAVAWASSVLVVSELRKWFRRRRP